MIPHGDKCNNYNDCLSSSLRLSMKRFDFETRGVCSEDWSTITPQPWTATIIETHQGHPVRRASCLRQSGNPMEQSLGNLPYVVPGGHVRCLTKMGMWILIITTITLTVRLTITIHQQDADRLAIAVVILRVRDRARARLRVLVLSQQLLLLPGQMMARVEMPTLITASNPVLLSPVTADTVTLTLGPEVTGSGSRLLRCRTPFLVMV